MIKLTVKEKTFSFVYSKYYHTSFNEIKRFYSLTKDSDSYFCLRLNVLSLIEFFTLH